MNFGELGLPGAFLVEPERLTDERGFFARTYCCREFEARGLNGALVQCNVSFNARRGTVRGLHFQTAPHAEAKLVRCTRGAVFDVLLDLRPASPTHRRWIAVRLVADELRMLYAPEGVAHGFQTLVDETELFYQMSADYHPEAARGVRWNDPVLAIPWPVAEVIVSAHDAALPLLADL